MPSHQFFRPHSLRGHSGGAVAGPTMEPFLCLWVVRLIIRARARDRLGRLPARWDHLELRSLGVEFTPNSDGRARVTADEFDAAFLRRLEVLEADPETTPDGRLVENVMALGQRLGLTDTEQEILLFIVLLNMEEDLADLFRAILQVIRMDTAEALALALDVDEVAIREALQPNSALLRSGLLYWDPRMSHRMPFVREYETLPGLAAELMGPKVSLDAVFQTYFRPSPSPDDALVQLPHLEQEKGELIGLLRSAARQRVPGINILLYGLPGTGKTFFARHIARLAGLEAVEVSHEDRSGEPHGPQSRQRAYQFSQHVMGRDERALIIFDETEDVFREVGILARGERIGGKGWTNHMLETNAVPAIWITNDVRSIEAAYLRRFTETLELRPPPRSVRAALLRRACEGLPVTEGWIARTAEMDGLTPAEIQKAVQVINLIAGDLDASEIEACLEAQIERSARLQGRPLLPRRRNSDILEYDVDVLNPDQELAPVVQSLADAGEGSLLLHGPPGTGKTALASHIAQVADRPLITRPASGILSPFVGMTERRIAALFEESAAEGAVLLIDEADSLLGSRESARARWEVSQTNELLVQIERFAGILIFATNFLSAIDTAALRRFDYKVELRPMTLGQRLVLFRSLAGGLGLPEPEGRTEVEEPLSQMDNLTPGDFGTVARRCRRRGNRESLRTIDLLALLRAESQYKVGTRVRRAAFS